MAIFGYLDGCYVGWDTSGRIRASCHDALVFEYRPDDRGSSAMTTRQLEPTPGWCDKAIKVLSTIKEYLDDGAVIYPISGIAGMVDRVIAASEPAAKEAELPEDLSRGAIAELTDVIKRPGCYTMENIENSLQHFCKTLLAEVDRRIKASIKQHCEECGHANRVWIEHLADERIGKARVQGVIQRYGHADRWETEKSWRIVPSDKA